MLPTDDKYKALSEIQKTLLYYMVMHSPTEAQIKAIGHINAEKQELEFKDEHKKVLDQIGLTDVMVDLESQLEELTETKFVGGE